MFSEHYWVHQRYELYALLQAHPDWGLRRLAHATGHDIKWVAKWRARFQQYPPQTLSDFCSASRAPHHIPQRTTSQAKQIVLELRRTFSERYHRPAGGKTLQYGIREYHQQHPDAPPLPRSRSTIYRVLHEMGCIAPRPRPPHLPLVLPPPMEEWELDFGEIFLKDEGLLFEFFIVVDAGTSRLVYLEGSVGYNAETALEALARLFATCGLPKRLRFDRDVRLWGSWSRDSYPSPMVRLLRALGIEAVVCPPHRPDKKPVVERCIETLKNKPKHYLN